MKAFYRCRREPDTGKRLHTLFLPDDNSTILYRESDDRFYFGLNAAEANPKNGISKIMSGDVENSGYTPIEIDDNVMPALIFGRCYRKQMDKARSVPLDAELRPREERGLLLNGSNSSLPDDFYKFQGYCVVMWRAAYKIFDSKYREENKGFSHYLEKTKNPEQWAITWGKYRKWVERHLKDYQKTGGHFLDVGGGTGMWAYGLMKEGLVKPEDYFLLDTNRVNIEEGRKIYEPLLQKGGLDWPNIVIRDAAHMPEEFEGKFSFVFSQHSIENIAISEPFFEHKDKIFAREMARVTKPGATLYLMTFSERGPEHRTEPWIFRYTEQDLQDLFEKNFDILDMETFQINGDKSDIRVKMSARRKD